MVCALAAGRDVGVDVEDLNRRPVEPGLVARYFAPSEVKAIDVGAPGWEQRFLNYWTLKEAYLKARGLGISVHLADVAFSLDASEPIVSFSRSLAGCQCKDCALSDEVRCSIVPVQLREDWSERFAGVQFL